VTISGDPRSDGHERPAADPDMPTDDPETSVRLMIDSYDQYAEAFRERFYAKERARTQNRDVMVGIVGFVRELLRRPSHTTVLDLGCGPGEHAHFLSRSTRSTTVIGADRSSSMLRLARNRSDGIRLARMDVRHLAFAAESFDAILASFIVNHVPASQVPGFFREVWRVARPQCALYIIVTEGATTDTGDTADSREGQGPVSYALTYTADDLSRYVTRAGFRVSGLYRSAGRRLHLRAVKPEGASPSRKYES
jgi:ubiquinone/menaquinone biosynthesis C-methylase UbiE